MELPDTVINEHELRVFGLQRSGIHALVNWIVQQSGGPTLFVNDVKSLAGSPYECAHEFHWRGGEGGDRKFDASAERGGIHSRKRRLVLGYEDTDLRYLPVGFSDLIGEGVGRSGRVTNVLIVRDPFNLFASRFGFRNSANRHPMATQGEYVRQLWKLHAREALGRVRYLGGDVVVVRYNDWFASRDYRRAIAESLGLAFSDEGHQAVPGVDLPKGEFARFGCGSSFDNTKFHGRAQEMAVLSRWERFACDQRYLALFDDAEVVSLSRELFGHVEGTEAMVGSLRA